MPATLPSDKRKLSPSNSRHPAQRRCPPPSRQTNANSALAVVQRSADDPQPIRQTTLFLAGCTSRGRGCCLAASAGGELILGRRKSALFYKSPLSERQQAASSDFCKTVLAEFRRPRSQPPTKPQTRQHPLPRRPVRPSAQKRRHPHFSVSPPESYTHFLYISP